LISLNTTGSELVSGFKGMVWVRRQLLTGTFDGNIFAWRNPKVNIVIEELLPYSLRQITIYWLGDY